MADQTPTRQTPAPNCRQCGYDLRTLPLFGNCPECGLAIYESMIELPSRPQRLWMKAALHFVTAGLFARLLLEVGLLFLPVLSSNSYGSAIVTIRCVGEALIAIGALCASQALPKRRLLTHTLLLLLLARVALISQAPGVNYTFTKPDPLALLFIVISAAAIFTGLRILATFDDDPESASGGHVAGFIAGIAYLLVFLTQIEVAPGWPEKDAWLLIVFSAVLVLPFSIGLSIVQAWKSIAAQEQRAQALGYEP